MLQAPVGYYTTKTQNKSIILIIQSVNYKVHFHPLRESKMCPYIIGSSRNSHYLISCRRSFIYSLRMHTCIRNKIVLIHIICRFDLLLQEVTLDCFRYIFSCVIYNIDNMSCVIYTIDNMSCVIYNIDI
jgi:hypothetical protein